MKKKAGWIGLWLVGLLIGGMTTGTVAVARGTPDLELSVVKAPNYQPPPCDNSGPRGVTPGDALASGNGNSDHASHHRPPGETSPIAGDEARKAEIVQQLASSTSQIQAFLKRLAGMSKQEQNETTVALTQKILTDLQDANGSIAGLLAPDSKEPDPKRASKITLAQRGFQLKFKRYQLDLSDTLGAEKAQQVIAGMQPLIPPFLAMSPATSGNHNSSANQNPNGSGVY